MLATAPVAPPANIAHLFELDTADPRETITTGRPDVTLALINLVWPNPWQPRQTEDPAHIADIAEKIRASKEHGIGHLGLWQPLLARAVPDATGGFIYELAFGMTRFTAYKQVNPQADVIPLILANLTDRQMSDLAAQENAARKDLNAIEIAAAIQRRMQEFGMKQLEAGEPFGYKNQGSISNLLRLLKLPPEIQDDVQSGKLPERLARQLVSVVNVKGAEKEVIALAKQVAAADPADREEELQDSVQLLAQKRGRSLDYLWPLNWKTPDQPVCRGCEYLFRHPHGDHCLQPTCFDQKRVAFINTALAEAALKMKLPIVAADENPVALRVNWDETDAFKALLKQQQSGKADHGLRLMESPEQRRYSYISGFDCEWITIGTVTPDQFSAAFKAAKAEAATKKSKETGKPAAAGSGSTATPTVQEQDAAARRAERGANLRLQADVLWLLRNVVATTAEQMKNQINGHALMFVCDRLVSDKGQVAVMERVYGVRDWLTSLEKVALSKTGKDTDRRAYFVAAQLCRAVFDYELDGEFNRQPPEEVFEFVCRRVADICAKVTPQSRYVEELVSGLALQLPAGWNVTRIHQTPGNCWHCGVFAAQRGRLTKGDLERGWIVTGDDATPTDVMCPDCAESERLTAATATKPAPKPAKKAKK